MANLARRRDENVAGEFYVDDSCIDCGTCYWVARDSFSRAGDMAHVHAQPVDAAGALRAQMALLACPTGSIGDVAKRELTSARAAFPDPIDGPVYHCGYHDEDSFGATAYLALRPEGNLLVDTPRFTRHLVRRIEEMGGVRWHFLTHRDDVGEHAKWHSHFGCERVMHEDDVEPTTEDVEIQVAGEDAVELAPDLVVIPTPGHTRGSACLLFAGRYLFTGDHLAFSRRLHHLYAFRSACWFDWRTQIRSMQRLAELEFEWVLPGHGERAYYAKAEMQGQMQKCVEWMRGPDGKR
jgi:glyoxylase-like metal-dependent hydrolase (beta-lactamase superfamily II)/ferredoxin